jgi:hypothetical protein
MPTALAVFMVVARRMLRNAVGSRRPPVRVHEQWIDFSCAAKPMFDELGPDETAGVVGGRRSRPDESRSRPFSPTIKLA